MMAAGRPTPSPEALRGVAELDHVVIVKNGADAKRRFIDWRERRCLTSLAYGSISYADGDCWEDSGLERSAQRYLHGFLFLSDWYAVMQQEEDDRALAEACELAIEWDRRFGGRYPGPGPKASISAGLPVMAYHDDATARRLIQLSHMVENFGDRMSAEHRGRVHDILRRTALLLATNEFYAGDNNHGLFQDLALAKYLAIGDHTLVEAEEAHVKETIARRLQSNLFTAFTTDGVHVENSPGYHFIVALLLVVAVPVLEALRAPRAHELRKVLQRTERFATHVLRPDGTMPPLGDTKPVRWGEASLTRSYSGADFLWSVTQGRKGAAPADRYALFTEAGYLIYRSSWQDLYADHCIVKSGYLSHYHHAADDIALLITSRRVPVISEAGHYGYDLQDPYVQYAYSQYAHNSVIVGGRSQPRVAGQTGGVSFEELPVTSPDQVVRVRGVNTRSGRSTWTRTVTIRELENDSPGQGGYDGPVDYVVEDDVDVFGSDEEDYEVRWHLVPGMRAEPRQGGFRILMSGGRRIADLLWTSELPLTLDTEHGVEGSEPRGWIFPEPGKRLPTTVLVLRGRGPRLRLVTTIRTRR